MSHQFNVGDKVVVATGYQDFSLNGWTEGAVGTIKTVFTDAGGYEVVGHGFPPVFLYYRQVKPFVPPVPLAPPAPPCNPDSVGVNSPVEQNPQQAK